MTLSGTIDSYLKKLAAEKGARKVSAVKAVIENLEVHLPTNKQKSDQQIAEQVLHALRWHTAVSDEKLKGSQQSDCRGRRIRILNKIKLRKAGVSAFLSFLSDLVSPLSRLGRHATGTHREFLLRPTG